MAFITIGSGAPSDVEPGTYTVILTELSDPKTVLAQKGPRAGEEIELLEWTFTIDEGELEGTQLRDSTSTSSGPKSKLFGWVTALLGKAPAPGVGFEKADLVGRRALASVIVGDSGWPRIGSLIPIPTAKPKAAAAVPAQVAQPAAAGEMPF